MYHINIITYKITYIVILPCIFSITKFKLPPPSALKTQFINISLHNTHNTLTVLDYYAQVSGLKINYTKSKAIWIGSKKHSKDVFHHSRWKLEWGDEQFTLLGINFSVNLESIIELNYESKIIEIEKLMKIWSIRKLTILGRITVLKSLVIPKLTHLFIALPNPSQTLLKYLNTVFF